MFLLKPLLLGSLVGLIFQNFGCVVKTALAILQEPSKIRVIHMPYMLGEGIGQLSR